MEELGYLNQNAAANPTPSPGIEAIAAERVLEVARICHEANRAICEAFGDYSQQPWPAAPEWQRESAVNGVLFTLANPDAGPSASHDNWSREKLAAGWRYGPTKDADAKTHPCLVSFNELPPEQQAKDHVFRAIVLTYAFARP